MRTEAHVALLPEPYLVHQAVWQAKLPLVGNHHIMVNSNTSWPTWLIYKKQLYPKPLQKDNYYLLRAFYAPGTEQLASPKGLTRCSLWTPGRRVLLWLQLALPCWTAPVLKGAIFWVLHSHAKTHSYLTHFIISIQMDIKCFKIVHPPTFLVPNWVNTINYYGKNFTHK